MSATAPPCILILAAGHGQRFAAVAGQGADKLLAACTGLDGTSRPVLEHTLSNLAGLAVRRIVVTRPGRTQVVQLAGQYGCEVVLIDSPGLGDSLAAGVAACTEASGWLVCLGDMPFIPKHTYATVLAAMADQRICVPVGRAGPGHPVGFGQAFAADLLALQGDQGAKRLFTPDAVFHVQVYEPGIYEDIDVPTDLR